MLSVQHVCFDRGCYSALSRMLRELQTLQYEPGYLPFSDDGQRALAKATHWFVPTPCCNHDCHNALKWSLSRYVLAEVAKDMLIVFKPHVECVRLDHGAASRVGLQQGDVHSAGRGAWTSSTSAGLRWG